MENTEKLNNSDEVVASKPTIERNKTIAILAYITFIGWVIAVVMNHEKKEPFASFHIRQMLGICCTALAIGVISMIPFLGWIVYIFGMLLIIFLWISGLIHALNEKEKPVPLLGTKYQEWFKNIL